MPVVHTEYIYRNDGTLAEDTVWEKDIKKHFTGFSQNIRQIWVYGFLEIFNNAIEHSRGDTIRVDIRENEAFTDILIADNGIGIFKNIKTKLNLVDEKDALLELAKGKRTTDITQHSGQGIFFVSKVFDNFFIVSDGITYSIEHDKVKQVETADKMFSTLVYMCLENNCGRKLKDVFDAFSTEIPGDFDKTIVPVRLANSTDLVSRSHARRVLAGLELFKEVILDFKDVEYIGQAFADEIFRVFVNLNPGTTITAQNTNDDIQYMINRAINTVL